MNLDRGARRTQSARVWAVRLAWGALCSGLVLATLGCPARRRLREQPLEAVPRVATFELRLRAYLDNTSVGDDSLATYLEGLEVEGCLVAEEGRLLDGLEGLRRLHRRTYERAGTPGRLAVWEVWRWRARRFSPDGRALVETYLDLPSRSRRFYFCEDGLPSSWRALDPETFGARALAYFAAEVESRRDGLEEGGADGARVVEQLRDLRSRIERRFQAQFDERTAHAASHDRVLGELAQIWDRGVDPHDLGAPVLLAEGGIPPHVAEPSTPPGEPATYADHPAASLAGAGGGGAPGRQGFGIPDPIDVYRRDKAKRSWRRTRRLMGREARELSRLADELVAELERLDEPGARAALLRELTRMENQLDQVYADLGRHQQKVDAFRTGRAVADMLVGKAKPREGKRTRRTRRRMDASMESMGRAVAVANAEGGGTGETDPGSPWGRAGGDSDSGTGETAEATEGARRVVGVDGVTWSVETAGSALVYEGPCPAPDDGWSPAVVEALVASYPFLDGEDARIFLALLERTYTALGDRTAIERTVREHLQRGLELRLGDGKADRLSEIHDPTRAAVDQEVIRFYVRLEL